MLKKAAATFAALVVIFALGLFLGLVARRWTPLGFGVNSTVLLTRVQNLRDLVTVKYVLEKVVVYDDPKWYGDNKVLLVAHGVVKAGIDLGSLKPGDIHVQQKEIIVTLPRPRITDVYLDDHHTQVLERSTGILRTFDKDLEQTARAEAVEDLRRAAAENGILADATERAKVELTALLYELGFTEVDVKEK